MPYLNHNVPPFSAYIRNEYLYNHQEGHGEFTFADIHTVNSMYVRECKIAMTLCMIVQIFVSYVSTKWWYIVI